MPWWLTGGIHNDSCSTINKHTPGYCVRFSLSLSPWKSQFQCVMVTEVRTSEKIIPADPATPASQENLMQQAGQVWFPDSAHKTATAIKDFKGEDLPLFILTNWRGFSGGQRDMFDEVLKVLKFGAWTSSAAMLEYSFTE
eukprot:jgi/Phyca11/19668/fgenesh1_pg.PHYCAscaffold_50_\